MKHLLNRLVAEWLLLRRISLAPMAAMFLLFLPIGMVVLLEVSTAQRQPLPPLADVMSVLVATVLPVNGLLVGLVLVFFLGFEFQWGTIRWGLTLGVSRLLWLASKMLAVVLIDGLVLLFSIALGLTALLIVYWMHAQVPMVFPWQVVFEIEKAGVLTALIVASIVALGTVATRSSMGGLVLGVLGYAADLALNYTIMDLYAPDLGASAASYMRYLVTWNAVGLALQEWRSLPESSGWPMQHLVLYAAVGFTLAAWVFSYRDLARRA